MLRSLKRRIRTIGRGHRRPERMEQKMSWYTNVGPKGDIVLSTRVRLARNIKAIPFPGRMDAKMAGEVTDKVKEALYGANQAFEKDFTYHSVANMSPFEKQELVEKHLISSELMNAPYGGAYINQEETVSIMVNEEDHIRLQVILPGLDLQTAYDTADKYDSMLGEKLDFAFSEKFGFITSCPTNMGTAMRASVMLHLPALTRTGAISNIFNSVGKLGLTIRGLYGEGTQAQGELYQISNQITLGQTEQEILNRLSHIVDQIVEKEEQTRALILENREPMLRNSCMQALGLLRHSYCLDSAAVMQYISEVRLGVSMGILKDIKLETLSTLLVKTQPASIVAAAKKDLSPQERDIARAALAAKLLSE